MKLKKQSGIMASKALKAMARSLGFILKIMGNSWKVL